MDVNNRDRRARPVDVIGARKNLSQHLANERTYLAYIRTAVALITLGIATNRFSMFLIRSQLISHNDKLLWNLIRVERAGIGMVIFGMILVIWPVLNYTRVRRQIDRGNFRPDLRIIWTIAIVIVFGGGLSLLWLFHR